MSASVPAEPLGVGRRRSSLRPLLAILAIALAGGVTAAVVAFVAARPDSEPSDAENLPPAPSAVATATIGGATGNPSAPRNIRLRDNGTSITLGWTDPSKGTVSFIVAGGQQGAIRQLQVLTPGSTTYTINGLNPRLDYCFTVAAVYDTTRVELSDLTCTKRTSASPTR